jgi:hypothetical protein
MQQAISALLVLGPLPSSAAAAVPTMQAFEEQLSRFKHLSRMKRLAHW